jgi:hypothetical protein
MNLLNKKWKSFKIEDVFQIKKGKYLSKKKMKIGKNPYISAISINNGINNFISNKILFPKNSITIEKINLSAFYQSSDFYCSHDVSVIQNQNINKFVALFINTMINRQGIKYSYGRQAQMNVIKRETILLPINTNDEPDYYYMEQYIKNLIKNKIKIINKRIENILFDVKIKKINKIKDKIWKTFFLTDIFKEIQRGKRLTKSKHITGKMPYISSKALNNGIDNFVSNIEKVRIFSNCLTLANSGSVGYCTYHPYSFVASDHVTKLENNDFSKYVYLFISTMVSKISKKYNFNREINDKRIKREKIMLPVNDEGEPDYEYMEQYMKNIISIKYKKYLQYIKSLPYSSNL